jgi:hypothetical protein
VQALDHLSVVYCDLAVRPLGTKVLTGPAGKGRVVVPGGTFDDHVRFITAAFGRYGSSDVIVMLALVRLADAERSIPRPTDLELIREAVTSLRSTINSRSELNPYRLLELTRDGTSDTAGWTPGGDHPAYVT